MGRKAFIALMVGIGIFAVLLWKLDFLSHWKDLLQMNFGWFFLSCGLLVLHQFLAYAKWRVMYRTTIGQHKQPLLPIFASVYVSGMLTPARSGDVVVSLSWKGIQGKVLAWSIFNRISEGVMTIVLSLCIAFFFFNKNAANIRWAFLALVCMAVLFLVFFVFSRKWGLLVFHTFRSTLQRFSGRKWIDRILSFEKKIEEQIIFFYDTMDQFRKKHALSRLLTFTVVNRIMIILVNMTLLLALGIDLPWTTVLGILAAIWVSVFLSPVPGGFGVGDLAPSLILANLGYKAQAGNFIFLNRLTDIAIVSFWAMMWSVTVPSKEKKASLEISR